MNSYYAMTKIIVANWKMNPLTVSEALKIASAVDVKGVVICPPPPFLIQVKSQLKKAGLGAQDVFGDGPPTGQGAFTGEISPAMLKKIGVEYVIIGHSERRRHLAETDEMIGRKIKAAVSAGLKVVLCVGEQLSVRKKGLPAAKNFVKSQLLKDLKGTISDLQLRTSNIIVAYEPIWAVGTGKPDNPSETADMAKFIKTILASRFMIHASRVLYGGSVTSSNIARILKYDEIGGALVGGASLKPGEFKKIIKISKKY